MEYDIPGLDKFTELHYFRLDTQKRVQKTEKNFP